MAVAVPAVEEYQIRAGEKDRVEILSLSSQGGNSKMMLLPYTNNVTWGQSLRWLPPIKESHVEDMVIIQAEDTAHQASLEINIYNVECCQPIFNSQ